MAEDRSRLALVETIWDTSLSKSRWMDALAERFGACVAGLEAPTSFQASVDDRGMHLICSGAPPGSTHKEVVLNSLRNTPPELLVHSRRMGDTGLLAFRHGDFPSAGDPRVTQPEILQFGGRDVFTVGARNRHGETICMTGCLPRLRGLRRNERRAWEQISAHLARAIWLREQEEALAFQEADLVLDADGLVVFRDPETSVSEDLLDTFNENLTQRLGGDIEAVSIVDQAWENALFDGEWSFVEQVEKNGSLHFCAVRNPVAGVAIRRLTQREREMIGLACSDVPLKALAAECDVSDSAFSRRVNAALRKMGLTSRSELILALSAFRLLGLVSKSPISNAEQGERTADIIRFVWQVGGALARNAITPSECEIVPLMVLGQTDRQIAKERGSSVRTVANQCQAIYRKLGIFARHELACWLVRQLEADVSE